MWWSKIAKNALRHFHSQNNFEKFHSQILSLTVHSQFKENKRSFNDFEALMARLSNSVDSLAEA